MWWPSGSSSPGTMNTPVAANGSEVGDVHLGRRVSCGSGGSGGSGASRVAFSSRRGHLASFCPKTTICRPWMPRNHRNFIPETFVPDETTASSSEMYS